MFLEEEEEEEEEEKKTKKKIADITLKIAVKIWFLM